MNYDLFMYINQGAGTHLLWDMLAIFFSKVGVFIPVLYFLWCVYRGWFKKEQEYRLLSWHTLLFTILCLIVAGIFSFIYWEPRPFVAHQVHLLLDHKPTNSFPSNHMAFAFSMAMAVFYHRKKAGCLLILNALLVGWSRIYVGHHYPGDILTSFIFVLVLYFLCQRYLWKKTMRPKRRKHRPVNHQ